MTQAKTELNLIEDTGVQLVDSFTGFFTDVLYNAIRTQVAGGIEQIAPLFSAGLGIYVMLIAMNWLRNGVDENLLGTMKTITGWLLIIAFAFNATNYMKIVDIMYTLPDKLAVAFSGNPHDSSSAFTSMFAIVAQMDKDLEEAAKGGGWFEFKGVYFPIGGAIMYLCVLAIYAVAMVFYLLAKLSMLLVLVVGPVFLGFMLYPSTRQYGMNWIGQLLNYTILITLYVVLANLVGLAGIQMLVKISNFGIAVGTWTMGKVWTAVSMSLVMLGLSVVIFFTLPGIVSALTGGAQFSTGPVGRLVSTKLGLGMFKRAGGSISMGGKR